eukprot:6193409-Pleurochrysis_carterae.AAC.3
MNDINNSEGVEQAVKALGALERPRRQTDPKIREENELALKQMVAGLIPEWQEADQKREKGVIALLRTWTREMMNCARMQMKTWITTKMSIKPKCRVDGTIGIKRIRHSRAGEKG